MTTPKIQLNEACSIPQIGLGTWQLTEKEGKEAIKQALDLGYRHLDTAYYYDNHQVVGEAVSESQVGREEMFITTKIWRDHLTEDKLKKQFAESLSQLNMEYVDLLLVHWPNESVRIENTLSAMQKLQEAGSVKAVGVSNFTVDLLQEAVKTGIKPAVNQVEYHPTLVQDSLKEFCDRQDITLTAYSPFGHDGQDLRLEPVKEIAEKKGVAPATVVVRWLIQQGIVAIPKATSKVHQEQNLRAADITLSEKEISAINDCNRDNRLIAPAFAPFSA